MAYLVLARKYRPQTFGDVIAQEHVTRTLRNAITSGRIGSGYIFCGPRGAGKTTVARLLAKAINCVNGPTADPCGVCASCVGIANGSSLDVLEIDAASNTSVDDIRNVRESIRYLPSSGRRRIYIIDEVHRLSGPAFDALLKTLEEPPAHAMFIFATTESQKVPETILSRTQRFDFRRVGLGDLVGLLQKIATAEGFEVDDEALRLVARKGDGSARDAISLLDQLLSFSAGRVTVEIATQALGLIDGEFLFRFVRTLSENNASAALVMIADLAEAGVDFKSFALELSEHIRFLTAMIITGDRVPGVELTAEELARLKEQAALFTLGDITRINEIIARAIADMKDIDQRWALEMATIKIATMESTVRLEEILAKLDSGESFFPGAPPTGHGSAGETSGGASGDTNGADLFGKQSGSVSGVSRYSQASQSFAPPAPPASPVISRPVTSFSANARTVLPASGTPIRPLGPVPEFAELIAQWPRFLESVRAHSAMLASQLAMATLNSIHQNIISASLPPSGAATKALLEKPEYRAVVEKALRDFYGANLTVKYDVSVGTLAPSVSANAVSRPSTESLSPAGERVTQPLADDAQQALTEEPRLKNIMDKVNGKIVRVRKLPTVAQSAEPSGETT